MKDKMLFNKITITFSPEEGKTAKISNVAVSACRVTTTAGMFQLYILVAAKDYCSL
jgi:outer membrane protein assembly factor BamA